MCQIHPVGMNKQQSLVYSELDMCNRMAQTGVKTPHVKRANSSQAYSDNSFAV